VTKDERNTADGCFSASCQQLTAAIGHHAQENPPLWEWEHEDPALAPPSDPPETEQKAERSLSVF